MLWLYLKLYSRRLISHLTEMKSTTFCMCNILNPEHRLRGGELALCLPPQTVADHHWPTATPFILTAQRVSTASADCCRSVTGAQCEPALKTDIRQTEMCTRDTWTFWGEVNGLLMAQPDRKIIHNHHGFLTAKQNLERLPGLTAGI